MEKLRALLKHLKLLSLVIPVGVVLASGFLPLQPLVRQALVGVILVWFGLEAMLGFQFWQ